VSNLAAKKGVREVGEDVYRCLSMAVEDRLRGMLHGLVKLSKQVSLVAVLGGFDVLISMFEIGYEWRLRGMLHGLVKLSRQVSRVVLLRGSYFGDLTLG
jgi:hypothetical protein